MTTLETSFISAIKRGELSTVTKMLNSEPSLITSRDEGDVSALLTAIYYQQPKIATLLIERGAPQSLFEACAAGSAREVVSILNQDPSMLNAFAPDGFQPLGLAAFFGHDEVVKILLDRDAEFDAPSKNGLSVTPLNSATAGRHLDIVAQLLERGANPNSSQADGFTPLHAAAQNGQRAMLELLLNHGANKEIRNKQGLTALDLAIQSDHANLSDLLR
jgi:ankyrin repeat protein